MTTDQTVEPPRTILVPVDLSDRAEKAVAYAAMLAGAVGAELVLTTNVNLPEREVLEPFATSEHGTVEEAAHAALHRIASRLAPGATVSFDLRWRDFPAEGILDAVRDREADLVVIASHGRSGMTRWLLGSVAEKIARAADVPVVIVPARD